MNEAQENKIQAVLELTKEIHDINTQITVYEGEIKDLCGKRGVLTTELIRVINSK